MFVGSYYEAVYKNYRKPAKKNVPLAVGSTSS